MNPDTDAARLARDLASLPHLPRADLADLWRRLYGAPPPAHTSRTLMLRAVAYRMQERALGGISPKTRSALMTFGEAVPAKPQPRELRPGTLLVREWHGVSHQVVVGEDSVSYRGQRYGSLSEVARTITGSRWSGPRFFGLKGHGKS